VPVWLFQLDETPTTEITVVISVNTPTLIQIWILIHGVAVHIWQKELLFPEAITIQRSPLTDMMLSVYTPRQPIMTGMDLLLKVNGT
jgi:hypothetical protein